MADAKRDNGSPSAVLFDLDGTLIDTKSLYLEAYRTAVQPYVRRELTPDDIKSLHPTSELSFLRAVVNEADLEACQTAFYQAYQSLHDSLFPGMFEGVAAVLEELRGAGVPLGLVTGKSRRSWEITSAAVTMGPFDVLVFDDDVRAPKPDPHGLEIALEALGTGEDADTAFYVGDTVSDARAAVAAGLQPVAALWSRPEEDRPRFAQRVRETGAVLVDRPGQLPGVLGLRQNSTSTIP